MNTSTKILLGVGAAGLLATILPVAFGGSNGGSKHKPVDPPKPNTPKPGPAPDPEPPADEPPADEAELDLPADSPITGVQVLDLRNKAPSEYIRRQRPPSEVRAVVLHQTAFQGWKPDNPNWAKIRAHFVVRRDGTVQMNFHPLTQLRVGSNHANPFSLTIEHEGNYPNANGNWWKPEVFGASKLSDAPKLVPAARQLLQALVTQFPITHVYAHIQWDRDKPNCPGPDLWREIGQWGVESLGLKDGGPGWHYDGGLAIPGSWRGKNA